MFRFLSLGALAHLTCVRINVVDSTELLCEENQTPLPTVVRAHSGCCQFRTKMEREKLFPHTRRVTIASAFVSVFHVCVE